MPFHLDTRTPLLLLLTLSSPCTYRAASFEDPNFFLLGVQKSSTTFIAKLLARHPSVCHGGAKEPHYFDSVDAVTVAASGSPERDGRYKDEIDVLTTRYIKNFKRCSRDPGMLTFDGTPINWIMAHRISGVYSPEQMSRKKFIVILRHPVDREFSWYNHQLRSCLYQMRMHPLKKDGDKHSIYTKLAKIKLCSKLLSDEQDFLPFDSTASDEAILAMPNLKSFRQYALPASQLRGDSLYVSHLKKWLSIVRRDQILILNFRYSTANTTAVMETLSNFLELKAPWPSDLKVPGVISSLTRGSTLDCRTSAELNKYFDAENRQLYDIINGVSFGQRPSHEPAFPPLTQDYKCKE